MERRVDAMGIMEDDGAVGVESAQSLGEDQPLIDGPMGIAVLLHLSEEAGSVQPGRPALRAADIAANALQPAGIEDGADIVEERCGDAVAVIAGEEHGEEAAQ